MPKQTPLLKEALVHCKALLRNGYDAYIINVPLQKKLIVSGKSHAVDIATDCDFATLGKIIPNVEPGREDGLLALVREEDLVFYYYPTEVANASHPELGLMRMTARLQRIVLADQNTPMRRSEDAQNAHQRGGFRDFACGAVQLEGLPSHILRHNYLLAIRTLRHAANLNLPVEPNTWLAIIQAGSRILDYVPTKQIMDEWRQVEAKSMWHFVRLLHDAHILHGIIPEVAALSRIDDEHEEDSPLESILDHTIACMQRYPEGEFEHDWLGVMAVLFQDVGKLYTGEFLDGKWTFYQHHRVGAGVTRKILRRLHFTNEDIDLVCHLVRNHLHFHFMLTDRGIRRFSAVGETKRLMGMCLADIQAGGGSYTNYNHNCKYLERAHTAEIMLEPLLNGNEIMEYTSLPPGPKVGILREALLKAQIAGDVTDHDSAVAFVRRNA